MLRRNAILSACSSLPLALSLGTASVPAASVDELPFTAQDLAEMELAAIQADRPQDWKSLSYVGDVQLDSDWSAIYVVTGDPRLLCLWCVRVDRAMYPGKLRVYDLGKAGQYPGYDDGFNHVTLFIVNRESLELERSAFADLKAKYPAAAA